MAAGVFVFSGGGSVATRPVDARDESADDAGENAAPSRLPPARTTTPP